MNCRLFFDKGSKLKDIKIKRVHLKESYPEFFEAVYGEYQLDNTEILSVRWPVVSVEHLEYLAERFPSIRKIELPEGFDTEHFLIRDLINTKFEGKLEEIAFPKETISEIIGSVAIELNNLEGGEAKWKIVDYEEIKGWQCFVKEDGHYQ